MAKRRVKRNVKQPVSSPAGNVKGTDPKEDPVEKKDDEFINKEVKHQIAAIRAIRDMKVERLQTQLRLLRSYFNEEQLQTPVLQFFKETLPNVEVVSNGHGFEVKLKDKGGNVSVDHDDGVNMHGSLRLIHQLSMANSDCSSAMPPFGGFEFPSKAVKSILLAADDMQISDFVLEEPSNTQILELQNALQTPEVNSNRLSVGMTPKTTLRLPKPGEMLLSVHGSPLGIYKKDNMDAIHESEES